MLEFEARASGQAVTASDRFAANRRLPALGAQPEDMYRVMRERVDQNRRRRKSLEENRSFSDSLDGEDGRSVAVPFKKHSEREGFPTEVEAEHLPGSGKHAGKITVQSQADTVKTAAKEGAKRAIEGTARAVKEAPGDLLETGLEVRDAVRRGLGYKDSEIPEDETAGYFKKARATDRLLKAARGADMTELAEAKIAARQAGYSDDAIKAMVEDAKKKKAPLAPKTREASSR
jgi:hypothetical protein